MEPGLAKTRKWNNVPANHLSIKEVWKRVTDPTSWWCVGAVTILALLLSAGIVLYFKPSLALDMSNTSRRGSLDWKKVLAICFVFAAIVFGLATFFRFKLLKQ